LCQFFLIPKIIIKFMNLTNQLTLRSRVLLEKLTVTHSRNFPPFMEHKSSLPSSHGPDNSETMPLDKHPSWRNLPYLTKDFSFHTSLRKPQIPDFIISGHPCYHLLQLFTSLCISGRHVLPTAWITSARILWVPGDLYLISLSIAISTSKQLCTSTNASVIFPYVQNTVKMRHYFTTVIFY
jgi:hypothetical protein